jgi:tRNA (guanine37-N1)-methyltransferase
LRNFANDKHKTVDDKAFGGGRGMVLKIEPIFRAINSIKKKKGEKVRTILLSPRGKRFNQQKAFQLKKFNRIVLISGRYEGVDERVSKYVADEELSIGDYVLMGGDLAALVVIETIIRLLPGVIGKSELLKERITKDKGFLEYPQYTRPEVFKPLEKNKQWAKSGFNKKKTKTWSVPKVLLSGNHKEIEKWREENTTIIGN